MDTFLHRLFPALHGEGVAHLLSEIATCPGLFYATSARDGILSRIRIPGGILNSKQYRAIADLADRFGGGYAHVTNRANLQVREIRTGIAAEVLSTLQDIGLASRLAEVDHIRNIMSSPTAGIDPDELIDTRPLVKELDNYISGHRALSGLSPKFSVAFDGGGAVQVSDRPNEIKFTAVTVDTDTETTSGIYFRLNLGAAHVDSTVDVLLKPEECLPVVVAIAHVYLEQVNCTECRPPRLKHLLNDWGVQRYLEKAQSYLPFPLRRVAIAKRVKSETQIATCRPPVQIAKYHHVGVHPQRQTGLSYIGVVLPVGRLETKQMRGLADLAEAYGSGTLRLTPWQNLLLCDIPNQDVPELQREIEQLGLHWSPTNIKSALVACSGNTGCASSATDTKGQALALAEYLEQHINLDIPVNIHFSGCQKSCADHGKSDITLLGTLVEVDQTTVEGYHVYVGDGDHKFGRELYTGVLYFELPALVLRMLRQSGDRTFPEESFREFANRYATPTLQQLFNAHELTEQTHKEVASR